MSARSVRLGRSGRLVIPSDLRRELGLEEGDEVLLRTEDGELRILGQKQALARLRAMVSVSRRPGDPTLLELLEDERRAQSESE